MKDRGGEFSLFRGIHVRTDISISIRPMTTKFGKQVHLEKFTQMTNQPGANDVIRLRSHDKLKLPPMPQCLLPSNLAGW